MQTVVSVQVSFVNSICTLKGGTHVKLVVDQICKYDSTESSSHVLAVTELKKQ